MKKMFPFLFLGILVGCTKTEVIPPPTLTLSTTSISIGDITSTTKSSLTLTKNGEGTISYTATSNKNWLKLDKTAGDITTNDVLSFQLVVPATELTAGNNTASITIVSEINGVKMSPVVVNVSGTYLITTIEPSLKTVDFGTISNTSKKTISLKKIGAENLTYTVTTDNSWIKLNKSSGTIASLDSISIEIGAPFDQAGSQTGSINLIPSVNGGAIEPIKIEVKAVLENIVTGSLNSYTLVRDEIWTGEIELLGSVTIPVGKTLTVRPGTEIGVEKLSNRIEINAKGTLLMNGSADKPIAIGSDAWPDSYFDWEGIVASGNVEISNVLITNANNAISFLFSDNPTKPAVLNNITFVKNNKGIDFLNSKFDLTVSNLSFYDNRGVAILTTNSFNQKVDKITFENIKFENTSSDIQNFGGEMNITVKNSNFTKNQYDFYYNVETYKTKNVAVSATNCYNLTSTSGFGSDGNVFEQTNISSIPLINTGSAVDKLFGARKRATDISKMSKEEFSREIEKSYARYKLFLKNR
ncbi:MAG: DUF5717 family protein [Spirosomaceae bacterium]|nr:DUF5717 family protein [Spirosomataceae bacterium]